MALVLTQRSTGSFFWLKLVRGVLVKDADDILRAHQVETDDDNDEEHPHTVGYGKAAHRTHPKPMTVIDFKRKFPQKKGGTCRGRPRRSAACVASVMGRLCDHRVGMRAGGAAVVHRAWRRCGSGSTSVSLCPVHNRSVLFSSSISHIEHVFPRKPSRAFRTCSSMCCLACVHGRRRAHCCTGKSCDCILG